MRDRLIELLKQKSCVYVPCDNECGGCKNVEMYDDSIESIADYLLSEGVIVPPCKVGTTLYFLYDSPYADKPDFTLRIYETNEWYFDVDERGVSIKPRWVHGYKCVYHYYLGKTVFLTREEAEKALERSENGKGKAD